MSKKQPPPDAGCCGSGCADCRLCLWKIAAFVFMLACAAKIGGPSAMDLIKLIMK